MRKFYCSGKQGICYSPCSEKCEFYDGHGGIWEVEEEIAVLAPPEKATIKVVLDEGAIMPHRAHEADAGYDLYAMEDGCIFPNARAKFDTGVHMAIPVGYEGHIRSRSSMMLNKGCLTDGTIDSGYTGSIGVILFNLSGKLVEIKKGEKIAQLVIEPIFTPDLEEVDELEATERGSGGFGSTGKF